MYISLSSFVSFGYETTFSLLLFRRSEHGYMVYWSLARHRNTQLTSNITTMTTSSENITSSMTWSSVFSSVNLVPVSWSWSPDLSQYWRHTHHYMFETLRRKRQMPNKSRSTLNTRSLDLVFGRSDGKRIHRHKSQMRPDGIVNGPIKNRVDEWILDVLRQINLKFTPKNAVFCVRKSAKATFVAKGLL